MWPWWVLQASIRVPTVTVARKTFTVARKNSMVWRSPGYICPVWVFLLRSFKLPGILALCSFCGSRRVKTYGKGVAF